jgi:hypothetical protein
MITALEEQVKAPATSVEMGGVPEQRQDDADMPDGVDLRDDRRMGRFRDAGARFASVDRDRCGT